MTTMKENPLGTQPINKLIWKFAIPGIISQLVNSAHNIVDQVFLGWGVNDLAIAATNVTYPFTAIMTALSALLGLGAVSKFSILLGEHRQQDAADYLGNAITLLVSVSLMIAIIASVFLEQILYLFGATDTIMVYAYPYARIIVLGIPLGIVSTGLSYFIRGDGQPAYASLVLLSGAVFNMVFDPVFLFLFDLGITGVALATVLGQLLSTVLALHYLLRKFKSVSLKPNNLKINTNVVGEIFSLGSATFATHVLATAAQIIQTNGLKTYGAISAYGSDAVIAAAGAVGKLTIVFLCSIIGIAIGCQPIFGYNLGNKNYGRVKETYLRALRYGTYVAVAAFLVLQLFPGVLLKIFGSDDPMFYAFATRYIRFYLAVLFVNALQPITSTFCTAIGKARLGFWMGVIRQGMLMIPLLLCLPKLLGIDGVLLAGSISDGLAAMVVIYIGRREIRGLQKLQEETMG